MKKKHNGSKLVALLLAALIVSSSSALVYAADTDTDTTSTTVSENAENTQEQTAKEKYLALLEYAKSLSADDYSADSYTMFTNRLQEYDATMILSMYPNFYTDYELEKSCVGINYAISLLNTDKNHSYYDELVELVEKGNTINKDDYTEESYNAFVEKFEALKNGNRTSLEYAETNKTNAETMFKLIHEQYVPCFNLLKTESYKEIVLEDAETGVKVFLNSNMVEDGCKLVVDKFDENNWDWINTDSSTHFKTAPAICSKYAFYSFTIYDADGNRIDLNDSFTVTIPLSDDFDVDTLSSSVYKNSSAGGAIARVSVDKDSKLVEMKFRPSWVFAANGGGILLRNPISAVDPTTLEDGIYMIEANLGYATDTSRQSMANATLDHNAYLVKSGDDIDVYLNFVPMYILSPDFPSYNGGLWCDKGAANDGEYYEDSQTVLSYYTNEDGSIKDNVIYNGVTEISCPKTIKLHLERSAYNYMFKGYTLAVSSPEMASMGNLTYEELKGRWDELTCNFLISKPVLVDTLEYAYKYLPTYDKSALRYEIDYSKSLDEFDYTTDSWKNLTDTVSTAQEVYDGEPTTEEITNQIVLVQNARAALVEDTSDIGDKTPLENLVNTAKTFNSNDYTAESYNALKEAVTSAQNVLAKSNAKQSKIDEQVTALQAAIDALEKKQQTTLDKDNLADGTYTVYADMIKTDRVSKSMSDNAIEHTVKLDVINGEYFVTVEFKGLSIFNQFGYLKKLSYYDAGYTYNNYGIPQGTVLPATVISNYDVVDQYNDADNPYPHELQFKLVDKASGEYVPLQVFVPIMEAITEGSGTQDVLMQIDWSTLQKKDADKLTNTSSLYEDTIQLGTSLTVNMGAEGGEGDYTYSVLYKKAIGTKWAVAQKPTTDTAATVKPAAAGQYYVMVKVKDASGNVAKKYFVVNVENNLKNTSALSAATIKKGESVTVNAAAEGTTGDYQYAVMYKKLTGTKWAVAQKYDANAEITFTPAAATEYEVCVKARDNNGAVAKKYFIVSVTK